MVKFESLREIEEEVNYIGHKLSESDFFDIGLMLFEDMYKISFGLLVNRKVSNTKMWESDNLRKVKLNNLGNFIESNGDRIILTTLPVLDYIKNHYSSF